MACDDVAVKRSVIATWLVVALAAACSGDDDLTDPTLVTSTTVVADPTSTAGTSVESPSVTEPSTDEGSPGPAPTDGTVTGSGSEPTASIVDVPETGVPGLDSDDLFCAAWSRFGGTWQVLLVGSTFLDDPQRVAEWEIAAANVVGDAYGALLANFPDALADEAEVVADGYFGVLDRRTEDARRALADAGATPDDVARLGEAWLLALESRDPSTPDLRFEIPETLDDLVDEAATDLRGRRVAIHVDPSMAVDAATPRTDAYLETTCPDQGTLGGQEIDPPDAG